MNQQVNYRIDIGQNAYSFVRFDITEPSILNGGDFGFEGAIFSLIAMLLTILAIAIYYHRQSQVPVAETNKLSPPADETLL